MLFQAVYNRFLVSQILFLLEVQLSLVRHVSNLSLLLDNSVEIDKHSSHQSFPVECSELSDSPMLKNFLLISYSPVRENAFKHFLTFVF
jgi:hypothetical protein